MDYSFESPGQRSGANSSVASDKLRKAIERNRAKQAKRESRTGASVGASAGARTARTARKENDKSQMSMGSLWSRKKSKVAATKKSPSDIRKRVAKPDDIEFTSRTRSTRTASSNLSYGARGTRTRRTTKRTAAKKPNKFMAKFPYLFWGFCLFLLVRLIFAERGVIDYYDRVGTYERFGNDLEEVQRTNVDLKKEIKKIKGSKSYQKKLVRDHLGYISKDEFLVLFPKDS